MKSSGRFLNALTARIRAVKYDELKFKIPVESETYRDDSEFVTRMILAILDERRKANDNRIIINTNLKAGLPLKDINKIAGPLIEAWAFEVFAGIRDDDSNIYSLIKNIDVKATSDDIKKSGKSPNITSFSRIRTAYVTDPDFMFIVLSIKHKVYSERNKHTGLVDGIMAISSYNAYDLKFISESDLSYNPALGTGQIQVNDIHYVSLQYRTTWEMCQLLDRKYLHSSRRTINDFYREAVKNKWLKE